MDQLSKDVKTSLSKCFVCNGWAPPSAMKELILESVPQQVCIACYRILLRRIRLLELEALKQEEEEAYDDEEAKEAFGSPEQ